jgi:hypothetical protein
LKFEPNLAEKFYAALQAAGMPEVPREFSVVPLHQLIPSSTLAEMASFIRVFDSITTRDAWTAAATRGAPAIAQLRRSEVCFFSAWDFHLPPMGSWQLIEFNDNGSGFILAAIINVVYYHVAELKQEQGIAAPASLVAFNDHIGNLVEREACAFLGEGPWGLFLILEDFELMQYGRFKRELQLLRDLLRRRGWSAELGCPTATRWDGQRLLFEGHPVSFIINRSTDFFWQSDKFTALRSAYEAGQVYVTPNPFTYATRSDKRLLEWLSLPHWDKDLGIEPGERHILSAHVPETHLLRAENVDLLAQQKNEFVFKPLHGFAGRGLLDNTTVGRTRLRRLVKHRKGYVAQRWVTKPRIDVGGTSLWTDLRVWAYQGEIFHISGRASCRQDRLELAAGGGWLPTYASL